MTHPYEQPTFLPQTQPVDLISQLKSYTLEGKRVLLTCAANHYQPAVYNFYGTHCEVTFNPPEAGEDICVAVDFCTPHVLRVRYGRGQPLPELQTPMVVAKFDEAVEVDVYETEEYVAFFTSAVALFVVREPWQLQLYNRKGKLIWQTRPVDIEPLRRPAYQWNPPQERWLFLHRYAYPCGLSGAQKNYVFASFDLHYDEHIYGLGEDFGRLDKRNIERRLWIQEGFGNASPAAYKHTPFYVSTRGYGLFVNTSNAVRFDIGHREHTALSVLVEDADWMDFYLIEGETIRDILPRYTDITGKPGLPPAWSFGLWMSCITYNSQQQVEETAEKLRQHQIPCDVIHIDTGWYKEEWVCDLEFGPSRFPDPAGMMKRLREKGFRICLWQLPNLVVESKLFHEAAQKGFLAQRPVGKPYLFSGFLSDAGLLDYSNPAAVEWIKGKFKDLFALGVAAIKADFGEGAPPDAVYHGVPGTAMHNLFPLLYNRAVFEASEEYFGKGNAVIWARSAWAGSQRYPLHWSGDGIARFEDLACVVRSALNFGLSGFPFYSHDVGGFSGLPSPELYARWIQLGVFSSHVRCHGQPPREPWEYGERTESIFREYVQLRYQLLPYLLSEAAECGKTSLPFLRALILEYPDDPLAPFIEDEYLFGSSMLVAPILDETNRRRVYLPAGSWMDYWQKTWLQGPVWLNVEAPLDVIPLYIRAGSIIPYAPPMNYVGEKPCDPLTVEIYPASGRHERQIWTPEGRQIRIEYFSGEDGFEIRASEAIGEVVVKWYGKPAAQISLGKTALPFENEENAQVFRFDARQPAVVAGRF